MLDNRRAALEATRHILSFGHRRIAMLSGPEAVSTGAERQQGYREALLEAGVAYDEALVRDAGFREERAYDSARELLSATERPSAVFAANNLIAIGLMRAIADLQLQCPRDVSVVSIDDFAWANAFRPRLTTVAQPVVGMGQTAMRMLLARMRGDAPAAPQLAVMAPMLLARDSCSAPAQLARRPRGAARTRVVT
jgi:LacI family transcriptional regulator